MVSKYTTLRLSLSARRGETYKHPVQAPMLTGCAKLMLLERRLVTHSRGSTIVQGAGIFWYCRSSSTAVPEGTAALISDSGTGPTTVAHGLEGWVKRHMISLGSITVPMLGMLHGGRVTSVAVFLRIIHASVAVISCSAITSRTPTLYP